MKPRDPHEYMKIVGSLGILFAWIFLVLLCYSTSMLNDYEKLTKRFVGEFFLQVGMDEASNEMRVQINKSIRVLTLTTTTLEFGGTDTIFGDSGSWVLGMWIGLPFEMLDIKENKGPVLDEDESLYVDRIEIGELVEDQSLYIESVKISSNFEVGEEE